MKTPAIEVPKIRNFFTRKASVGFKSPRSKRSVSRLKTADLNDEDKIKRMVMVYQTKRSKADINFESWQKAIDVRIHSFIFYLKCLD